MPSMPRPRACNDPGDQLTPRGTVSEAPPLNSEKNAGLYREGTVAPAADLNDLRELFILTGSTSAKK